MNNNRNNARLLPFTVIQKAAGGDVEAINTVLNSMCKATEWMRRKKA